MKSRGTKMMTGNAQERKHVSGKHENPPTHRMDSKLGRSPGTTVRYNTPAKYETRMKSWRTGQLARGEWSAVAQPQCHLFERVK